MLVALKVYKNLISEGYTAEFQNVQEEPKNSKSNEIPIRRHNTRSKTGKITSKIIQPGKK